MSQFQTTQEDWSVDYSQKLMDVRRQRYLRRASAARKLQAMYRRYGQRRQTQDRRQLGNVVRRYRAANPYQIQPSAGRTVSFWRKSQVSIALNQSTGFNGSTSLNWGFALKGTFGYRGGTLFWLPSTPGFSEWQALFDYYMINAVKMQIFYTKTVAENSTTVTTGMPVLLIANDFDDIAETMTLDSMNQRVGVRHVQFSADQPNGINHYIKPKPSTVVAQTADDGTVTAANAGVPFGTTWLDCAQSNIVHNGIKVFYDQQGLTTNVALGNITFVFDVEYVFKGYR